MATRRKNPSAPIMSANPVDPQTVASWQAEHPSVSRGRLVALYEASVTWGVETSGSARDTLQELVYAQGWNQSRTGIRPQRPPNDAVKRLGQELGVDVEQWMALGYQDGRASMQGYEQNPKRSHRSKYMARKKNTQGRKRTHKSRSTNPGKRKRNAMTKKEFERMFEDEIMPMIMESELRGSGRIDKPGRRQAWNDTIDAYIKDGTLPERAGDWSKPKWLLTRKPKVDRVEGRDPWEMANNPSARGYSGERDETVPDLADTDPRSSRWTIGIGKQRVYDVSYIPAREEIVLVRKVVGPEPWQTDVEAKQIIVMDYDSYQRIVESVRSRFGIGQRAEREAYRLLAKSAGAQPNPSNAWTRDMFEVLYIDGALPVVATVHEQSGGVDKKARREAWRELVESSIEDGLLPPSARDWSYPERLDTIVIVPVPPVEIAAIEVIDTLNDDRQVKYMRADGKGRERYEKLYEQYGNGREGRRYVVQALDADGEVIMDNQGMGGTLRVFAPREQNPSYSGRRQNPPKGTIKIERKGYCVDATTYKKGGKTIRRDAYCVPASTFYVKDRGKPGRGPDIVPELKEGALEGWHADEPKTKRHKALEKCVKKASYRTCLGRLQWLKTLGKRTMSPDVLDVIEEDRVWLVKKYGGPGSFKRSERRERAREARAANPDMQKLKRKLMR